MSKYVVMLKTPMEEDESSTVALQLAEKLNVSISKMMRLLSGTPGPLTKPIDETTANKLLRLLHKLNVDAELEAQLDDAFKIDEDFVDKAVPASEAALADGAALPRPRLRLPLVLLVLLGLGLLFGIAATYFVPQLAQRNTGLIEAASPNPDSADTLTAPLLEASPPASTDTPELLSSAASRQDFSNESTESLQTLAEEGNSEAQYELAWRYVSGIEGGSNYSEAARWLTEASNQGHAEAQYHLGLYYLYGHGVDKDEASALELFRTASRANVAEAQYRLGLMHLEGIGTEVDLEEAQKWLSLASEQGIDEANDIVQSLSLPAVSQTPQRTSIFSVAKSGSTEDVISVLLAGTNINTPDTYGQTPLMYASGSNSSEVILELIGAGAEVNLQSNSGWSALMFAARDNPAVIETLLEQGADRSLTNSAGQTAFDIALKHNPETALMLFSSAER